MTGPHLLPEPKYAREVFERLRETLDVLLDERGLIAWKDEYIAPNYVLREDGAWLRPNADSDSLNWTPSCDLDEGPTSLDPLITPALPFPFTARQFAAFMLDGWGRHLAQRFAGKDGQPDMDLVQTLLGSVRDAQPRKAIVEAFSLLAQARQQVGVPDMNVAQAEQAAAAAFDGAMKEANRLHNWREVGIAADERNARVRKRNKLAAAEKAALRRAREAREKDEGAWRKAMVRWLLTPETRKLSREEWGSLSNNEKVNVWTAGRGPDPTHEEDQQNMIGWYDATIRADYWLGLASVTAVEAAQLLSCENPLEAASKTWLDTTSEQMNPEARRELLRGFEDEGGTRSLTKWLQRAKSRGWRYDPWIDEYIEAAGGAPGAPATDAQASTRPLPRARAQENAILAKFKELGLDPMRLPKPKPGQSSPPVAKVRAALRSAYTPNVMQKAMTRLFEDGRAAYDDTPAD